MFPEFKNVTFNTAPYKYFTSSPNINDECTEELLNWFEFKAPWKLVETDFYEQYEFSLNSCEDLGYAQFLIDEKTLFSIRTQVERLFEIELIEYVEVVAHKLVKGQTIRIHNDFLGEQDSETHRVLLQLNRGFEDSNGGYLMIFNNSQTESLKEVIPPISGSVQGFEISKDSHHAVSTIHSGERYTIVYSFRKKSENTL